MEKSKRVSNPATMVREYMTPGRRVYTREEVQECNRLQYLIRKPYYQRHRRHSEAESRKVREWMKAHSGEVQNSCPDVLEAFIIICDNDDRT